MSAIQERRICGFGEIDTVSQQNHLQKLYKKITVTALAIIGAFGMAITCPSLLPTSQALGGISVLNLSLAIRHYFRFFTAKAQPPLEETQLAPKLGEYTDGHTVALSQSGQESIEWKLDLLKNARQSIELSGNFCGGEAFQKALKNIEFALWTQSELKVHIISSKDLLEKEDRAMLESLKAHFPDRFHYLLTGRHAIFFPRFHSVENHTKLLVVDENYFVLGGTGLQQAFCCKGDGTDSPPAEEKKDFLDGIISKYWRDTDLLGQGPLAKTMRQEFFKLWALWSRQSKSDQEKEGCYFPIKAYRGLHYFAPLQENARKVENIPLKFLVSSPQAAENAISNEYASLLEKADKYSTISIGNLLFNPPPSVYNNFLKAAKKGCKLDILTNGIHEKCALLSHFYLWPNRLHYYPFFEQSLSGNNVRIFEYRTPWTLYHKKAMVVDNETLLGSYNLGWKSHYSDHEIAVVAKSPILADQMRLSLIQDQQRSALITPKRAKYWYGIGGILGRIERALFRGFSG